MSEIPNIEFYELPRLHYVLPSTLLTEYFMKLISQFLSIVLKL